MKAVAARFHVNRGNYLVLRIKVFLLTLSQRGSRFLLAWIPSRGTSVNERADSLARDAFWCGRDSRIGILMSKMRVFLERTSENRIGDVVPSRRRRRGGPLLSLFPPGNAGSVV